MNVFCFQVGGSSPRVWGKVRIPAAEFSPTRIIPTRVGKRTAKPNQPILAKDHPHACGEKFSGCTVSSVPMGSSPRVWGKDELDLAQWRDSRIIPTRVGKSSTHKSHAFIPRDHPHACGEKSSRVSGSTSSPGSSPRVWGKGRIKSK